MPDFPVTTDIEVRFRDTDAMGHVNNAAYVTYLEVGRQAYWKAMKTDQQYEKVPFVLAHVEIDFRKQATTGDVLRVALKSHWIGRSSFGMKYELTNQKGELVAQAESAQVTYDYAAERTIPVPDWLRTKLESVEGRPLPQRNVEW